MVSSSSPRPSFSTSTGTSAGYWPAAAAWGSNTNGAPPSESPSAQLQNQHSYFPPQQLQLSGRRYNSSQSSNSNIYTPSRSSSTASSPTTSTAAIASTTTNASTTPSFNTTATTTTTSLNTTTTNTTITNTSTTNTPTTIQQPPQSSSLSHSYYPQSHHRSRHPRSPSRTHSHPHSHSPTMLSSGRPTTFTLTTTAPTPSTPAPTSSPSPSKLASYAHSLSAQQQLQLHQKEIIHQATRIPQLLGTSPMSPRLIPLGSPGPVTPLTLEEGDGFFAGFGGHGCGGVVVGRSV